MNIKANQWGQVILTNVGSLGLEAGFAPMPPPLHGMFLVCTGKCEKRPVVVDNQVVIRDIMTSVYTFDHRYGDAAVGMRFEKIVRAYLNDPEHFDFDSIPESNAVLAAEETKKTQ